MIPDEFIVGMTTLPVVEVPDGVVPLAALTTPKLTEVELVAVVPLPLWVMEETTDPDEAATLCTAAVGVPPELDTEVVVPVVTASTELEVVAAVSDEDDEAAAAAAAAADVVVVPAVAAPVDGLS
jgi:hypothetical protein